MQYYQTKAGKIAGTNFKEVHEKAFDVYLEIRKKTKRRPYIRSTYFRKEKIFLNLYWEHLLSQDNWRDRLRRIKYFIAAIELMKNTTLEPTSKENPNKSGETFHRFSGKARDGEVFFVQIKEYKKKNQKYLISIFPE